MKHLKNLLALSAFAAASAASAAPIVTSYNGTAALAEAAFATWQAGVSAFSVDQLTGLAGSFSSMSSTAGNTFAATGAQLFNASVTQDVLQGTVLEVDRTGATATVVWTLASPSNAFSFFGWDLDNGVLTVAFTDGGQQSYSLNTTGSGLSAFWGISGLSSSISSVTFSTTDSGGVSYFDRFATATSVVAVPEPATLALTGLALAAAAAVSRRRKA